MPFETPPGTGPRRIAIVGAGVSGLGAAYALAGDDHVVLFEAERRLGGHARTVTAGRTRESAVDTGFIVFNDRNYPNLTALFRDLDVPSKASDMSFGASFDGGAYEYALRGLNGLFGQRRNLARPAHWGMLRDILRFNAGAGAALTRPDMTLGDLLENLGVGDRVRDRYVLPFSGAIWSATPAEMLAFPAASFVRFFQNHGLLSASGHPQWMTVDGGSRIYVEKLKARLDAMRVDIRAGAPVEAVWGGAAPRLKARGGEPETFDAIVLACHADQSLAMLADPEPDLRRILGSLRYKPNRAVLHDDARLMPRRRRCWSSWNYVGDGAAPAIGVTYWMNRLQDLRADQNFFVTLNPPTDIPDERIFDETSFAHPQFDRAALDAQADLPTVQGRNGLWFCGAYARYGFHEDGLASGLDVAAGLGAVPAWA